MRRIAMIFAAAAICMALGASRASAVGIGGYLEFAGGGGEFDIDDSGVTYTDDVTTSSGTLGFILDTGPGGTSPFSYRLNLGLERLDIEFDDLDDTLEMGGLVIDNTFAFAAVRSPAFRLWMGPQLNLGFYGGEFEDNSDIEAYLTSLAIGFTVGANIYPNPNGRFAISPSIGLRYTGYWGEWEDTTTDYSDDLEGGTGSFFFNVAFLFGR